MRLQKHRHCEEQGLSKASSSYDETSPPRISKKDVNLTKAQSASVTTPIHPSLNSNFRELVGVLS